MHDLEILEMRARQLQPLDAKGLEKLMQRQVYDDLEQMFHTRELTELIPLIIRPEIGPYGLIGFVVLVPMPDNKMVYSKPFLVEDYASLQETFAAALIRRYQLELEWYGVAVVEPGDVHRYLISYFSGVKIK